MEDSSQGGRPLTTGCELDLIIQLAAAFKSFRLSRMKLTVLPQAGVLLAEVLVQYE